MNLNYGRSVREFVQVSYIGSETPFHARTLFR